MPYGPSRIIMSVVLAAVVCAAMLAPLAVRAQEAETFDIPSQDLAGALRAFAVATDTEILYSAELVANRRSGSLIGEFTMEEALRRLLADTGLAFERAASGVLVLKRLAESGAAGNPGGTVAADGFQAGLGVMQPAVAGAPGRLGGVVRDAVTATPLSGASVKIEGTDLQTVSDERGLYRFPDVQAGLHPVVVDWIGTRSRPIDVRIEPGQASELDLEIGDSRLETIVVLGYRSGIERALNQQRTASNNATVVSADLLGGFPAETVSEALRRVPGVAFGRSDDTGEGSRITIRGFSSEAINVQLNGLDLQGTGFERTIDLSGSELRRHLRRSHDPCRPRRRPVVEPGSRRHRRGRFHGTVPVERRRRFHFRLAQQPARRRSLHAFQRGAVRAGRLARPGPDPGHRCPRAQNFDLDVAYYFKDTPGVLRAGVFYKDVDNNFTNVLLADIPNEDLRERVLDHFAPLADTRPDLLDFAPDTEFLLSHPSNGEGGTIWGAEVEIVRQLDFLPGFLSNFGVLGNATYTDGDFPTLVTGRDDDDNLTDFSLDRPLADQAEWVYNASINYARSGFEGRLIYTYQSATADIYEVHDLNTVIPSYSTLDCRLSYNFEGPGDSLFTLFLEGDDLLRGSTEADIRRAIEPTFGRDDADYSFARVLQFNGGRTVTAGIRARF
jgi:hypothetical protein